MVTQTLQDFTSSTFWDDFATDSARSVSEADRQLDPRHVRSRARHEGRIRVFRAFEEDPKDFAGFTKRN